MQGWLTRGNGKREPITLNDDGVFLLDGSEIVLGYPISLSMSLDSNEEPNSDAPMKYVKFMTSNNIKFELDPNSTQTRQNVEKWLFKQNDE